MNKKGQVGGVAAVAAALVVVGIMLLIGFLVYAKVSSAIPQGSMSATENTTLTNMRTNITSGFELGGIMPLVLAATGLIALVSGIIVLGRR